MSRAASRSLAWALLSASAATAAPMNFTVTSWPVELRYGQVHNRLQWNEASPNWLPRDVIDRYASGEKLMALSGFDVEMYRIDADGRESLVTLDDHYLHHYILYFGEAQAMAKMFKHGKHHAHAAHAFDGCHGMRGRGVHLFKSHMADSGLDSYLNVGFGSAAGAEFRHNLQRFEEPYRLILLRPDVWAPTLHIINTNEKDNQTNSRDRDGVSRLLECPCTPQRDIDVAAGTIDGRLADPPIQCSPEFNATGNPSCHLSTYVGGWRCCEHGVFLVDTDKECRLPGCVEKPVDQVFMRFTFFYEDAQPGTRNIEAASCCDVTADSQIQGVENIEYDVIPCPAGTAPDECTHVVESVQPLGYFRNASAPSGPYGSDLVDLVFAAPHLHWAGTSIVLVDSETNETLCEVHRTPDNDGGVMYGRGSGPGDESGYLVGLTPCSWGGGTARRFRRDHMMRTRVVYNATSYHTGVMSLWLVQVSAVPADIVV